MADVLEAPVEQGTTQEDPLIARAKARAALKASAPAATDSADPLIARAQARAALRASASAPAAAPPLSGAVPPLQDTGNVDLREPTPAPAAPIRMAPVVVSTPAAPAAIIAPPTMAPRDASRLPAESARLAASNPQQHHVGGIAGAMLNTAGAMMDNPVSTATALQFAPLKSALTAGRFIGQKVNDASNPEANDIAAAMGVPRVTDREAAFAAAQLAALSGGHLLNAGVTNVLAKGAVKAGLAGDVAETGLIGGVGKYAPTVGGAAEGAAVGAAYDEEHPGRGAAFGSVLGAGLDVASRTRLRGPAPVPERAPPAQLTGERGATVGDARVVDEPGAPGAAHEPEFEVTHTNSADEALAQRAEKIAAQQKTAAPTTAPAPPAKPAWGTGPVDAPPALADVEKALVQVRGELATATEPDAVGELTSRLSMLEAQRRKLKGEPEPEMAGAEENRRAKAAGVRYAKDIPAEAAAPAPAPATAPVAPDAPASEGERITGVASRLSDGRVVSQVGFDGGHSALPGVPESWADRRAAGITDGFATSSRPFVTREEGLRIARDRDQLRKAGSPRLRGGGIYEGMGERSELEAGDIAPAPVSEEVAAPAAPAQGGRAPVIVAGSQANQPVPRPPGSVITAAHLDASVPIDERRRNFEDGAIEDRAAAYKFSDGSSAKQVVDDYLQQGYGIERRGPNVTLVSDDGSRVKLRQKAATEYALMRKRRTDATLNQETPERGSRDAPPAALTPEADATRTASLAHGHTHLDAVLARGESPVGREIRSVHDQAVTGTVTGAEDGMFTVDWTGGPKAGTSASLPHVAARDFVALPQTPAKKLQQTKAAVKKAERDATEAPTDGFAAKVRTQAKEVAESGKQPRPAPTPTLPGLTREQFKATITTQRSGNDTHISGLPGSQGRVLYAGLSPARAVEVAYQRHVKGAVIDHETARTMELPKKLAKPAAPTKKAPAPKPEKPATGLTPPTSKAPAAPRAKKGTPARYAHVPTGDLLEELAVLQAKVDAADEKFGQGHWVRAPEDGSPPISGGSLSSGMAKGHRQAALNRIDEVEAKLRAAGIHDDDIQAARFDAEHARELAEHLRARGEEPTNADTDFAFGANAAPTEEAEAPAPDLATRIADLKKQIAAMPPGMRRAQFRLEGELHALEMEQQRTDTSSHAADETARPDRGGNPPVGGGGDARPAAHRLERPGDRAVPAPSDAEAGVAGAADGDRAADRPGEGAHQLKTPTVQRTLDETGDTASPAEVTALMDAAEQIIRSRESSQWDDLKGSKAIREWAARILGRPYASGTWKMDDAYDAIEGAVNRLAREQLGPALLGDDLKLTGLDSAKGLEDTFFGGRLRSSGMLAMQQFSTPLPIARAAQIAASVVKGEKVLEPTAGTGNLVNFLRDAGVDLSVNELEPRRVAVLRALGLQPTVEDALRLPMNGKRYNAIITNPPYGAFHTGKYAGEGATPFAGSDISQRFIAAALQQLVDGGRLVAVMPANVLGAGAKDFRKWLNDNHTPRLFLESPEGAYETRGTGISTVMMVVDRGPPPKGYPGAAVYSFSNGNELDWKGWEQVMDRFVEGGDLARATGREPAVDVAPITSATGSRKNSLVGPKTEAALIAPTPGRGNTPPEGVTHGSATESDAAGSGSAPPRLRAPSGAGGRAAPLAGVEPERPASGSGDRPVAGAGRPADLVAGDEPGDAGAGTGGSAAPVVLGVSRGGVEPRAGDSAERRAELDAARHSPVFTPYPLGIGERRSPHPRLVVETRAMAGLPAPPITATVGSPLVDKAWGRAGAKGGISDEQMDAVQRTLTAWDHGHGMIVADDVGVGKTREAAAIVLEAIHRGAKRILYTTKNENNVSDAMQEFRLVASGKDDGDFPATFVQVGDYKGVKAGTESLPAPDGPVVYFAHSYNFAAYAEALGDVQPDVWIGDEAHEYKNQFAARGIAWQGLHKQMLERGGRFAYFTATPAVTLDELGYLYGLKEWPVGGFADWVDRKLGKKGDGETSDAGHEAAEASGADIRAMGDRTEDIANLHADDADIKGGKKKFMRGRPDVFGSKVTPAETEQVMRELKGAGKYIARDLWRGGVKFDVHPVDLLGDEGSAVRSRQLYDQAAELARDISMAARKFGRMNAKVKTAGLDRAMIQSYLKQLLFGMRLPTVLNEAKAALSRGEQVIISLHSVAGDAEMEEGLSEADSQVPLNERLKSAINRINTEEVKKVDGEFQELGEIPEALMARAELMDRLGAMPPLVDPVRAIEERFGAKKVAVITGKRTAKQRKAAMGEFQSGARQVAVISKAGKVGISLHDVNGRKRRMLVADYEWSADTFKQELGRVDRTGQRSSPHVSLVASNLAGERKFAATIAARMASLGATSKGSAESTGTDALDQFDVADGISLTAMRNTVTHMNPQDRRLFTGSKFTEVQRTTDKQWIITPKRTPDDAGMRDFLLEMMMFPVEASNRTWAKWVEERDALRTGDTAEEAAARRTGRAKGEVLKRTLLTAPKDPALTMVELKNEAGERRAVLQGFVTPYLADIQQARGTTDQGGTKSRKYVHVTTPDGELVTGLDLTAGEARRVKQAFGKGERKTTTPEEAWGDLQTGEAVAVQGPGGERWLLHPRRDGRIQIKGATLAKHQRTLQGFANYETVGNYLYVPGKPEAVQKFLERFPPEAPGKIDGVQEPRPDYGDRGLGPLTPEPGKKLVKPGSGPVLAVSRLDAPEKIDPDLVALRGRDGRLFLGPELVDAAEWAVQNGEIPEAWVRDRYGDFRLDRAQLEVGRLTTHGRFVPKGKTVADLPPIGKKKGRGPFGLFEPERRYGASGDEQPVAHGPQPPEGTAKQLRGRADREARRNAKQRREQRIWADHATLSDPKYLQAAHQKYADALRPMSDADLLAYARGFDVQGLAAQPPLVEVLKERHLMDQLMGPKGVVGETAWHGTPHRFDRFSLDHIGSGEGAQSYGWGLYFAGKKEVAEWYREKLSRHASPRLEDIRDYFTPGNIVPSYSGYDRVIRFSEPPTNPQQSGGWGVMVQAVKQDATGAWVDMPGERPRYHHTTPSAANLDRVLGASATRFAALTRAENATLNSATHEHLIRDDWPSSLPARIDGVIAGDRSEIESDKYELAHRVDYGPDNGDTRTDEGIRGNIARIERRIAALEKLKASGDFSTVPNRPKPGALYHVEIPDDDTMLNWDKPLNEQPEKVKVALAPIFAVLPAGRLATRTGEGLYHDLSSGYLADKGYNFDGDKESSRFLASLGIDGIKYLDGASRARGEGHHNYVVFDDQAVKVLAVEEQRHAYDAARTKGQRHGPPSADQMELFAAAQQDPAGEAAQRTRRAEAVMGFGSEQARDAALEKYADTFAAMEALKLPTVEQRQQDLAAHRAAQPAKDAIDLRGVHLRDRETAAKVMDLHRDPQMEKFHAFHLSAPTEASGSFGVIQGHTADTVGALNFATVSDAVLDQIGRDAQQYGTTQVVFGHNHPSGDAISSKNMDVPLTVHARDYLREHWNVKVVGHVIIDHHEYAWIEPDGTATDRIPFEATPAAYQTALEAGRKTLGSPTLVARLLTGMARPDALTVVVVDTQHRVLAVTARAASATATIDQWMHPLLEQTGGSAVFLALPRAAANPEHTAVRLATRADREARAAIGPDLLDQWRSWWSKPDLSARGVPSWARDVLDIFAVGPDGRVESLSSTSDFHGVDQRIRSSDIPNATAPVTRLLPPGGLAGRSGAPGAGVRTGDDAGAAEAGGGRPGAGVAGPVPPQYGVAPSTAAAGGHPMPDPSGLGHSRSLVRFREMLPAIRALLHPEGLGPEARGAAGTLRHVNALGARELIIADEALRAFRRNIDTFPRAKQVEYWNQAEQGLSTGDPGTDAGNALLHQITEQYTDQLIASGRLKAETAIMYYIGRFWSKPTTPAGRAFLNAILGRRPIGGPKSFLLGRSLERFTDGLDAGLIPATYNWVESQLAKIAEMQRLIGADKMLAAEQEAGRATKVLDMLGKQPPVDAEGEKWVRIGQYDDPAFTIYGPRTGAVTLPSNAVDADVDPDEVGVLGQRVLGHWYAPKSAAAVWNAHLSKGLKGHALVDAYMAPAQAAAQLMLGLSGFHFTVIATEGAFSDLALSIDSAVNQGGTRKLAPRQLARALIAPVRTAVLGRRIMQEYRRPGTHPALARVLDGMIAGGYRGTAKSELWTGERKERLRKDFYGWFNAPSMAARLWHGVKLPTSALYAGLELASSPIMEKYVPWMKTGATYNAVAQALRTLPPDASLEQIHDVMSQITKEMDYRFGQVVYDNHFINNAVKNAMQMLLLAPGWTGGTLALMARGVRDVARTAGRVGGGAFGGESPLDGDPSETPPPELVGQSAAYWIGAVLGTMLINGVLTYLNTGEQPHGKDFFAFRDGTIDQDGNANRHTIPGYLMHDVYGWTHHPTSTALNKLSPTIAFFARAAQNRTYFGDQMYDPDAPAGTQAKQIAKAAVGSVAPLSLQNFLEGKKRGESGPGEMARSFFGVGPAKREFVRTDAQNKMAEYLALRGHTARTPAEVDAGETKAEIREGVRDQTIPRDSLRKLVRAGALTRGQAVRAATDARKDPLVVKFEQLTPEQAQRVYNLGDEREKALWAKPLRRMLRRLRRPTAP